MFLLLIVGGFQYTHVMKNYQFLKITRYCLNKYCTTSSIAESVVPSIAKNQELNKIGLPNPFVLRNLGGNQLGKLKLFTESNEKNIIDLNNSTISNNNDNNNKKKKKNNYNNNNNNKNNNNNNNNNNDLLFVYPYRPSCRSGIANHGFRLRLPVRIPPNIISEPTDRIFNLGL